MQELYLQNNNIRKLPVEILNLTNLSVLNIAQNNLKCLPELMGELRQLIELDISHNKQLTKLPKSLGHAQLLKELQVTGLNLSYPPQDIISGGVIVIIAFLARECGIEYMPENLLSETDAACDTTSENRWMSYQNKDNDIQVQFLIDILSG